MRKFLLIIKYFVLVLLMLSVVGLGVVLYRNFYSEGVVEVPGIDDDYDDGGYEYEVEDITLNETEIIF